MGTVSRIMRHTTLAAGVLAALVEALAARPTWAGETGDLLALDLEALMQVEVVSASATARTLDETASAVYVLTAADIRRSGARDLPDLLRHVPGLQVARINDHTWAVSARGFNGRFANLLLVMVAGQAVYESVYGGVYWDTQNVPLRNVERIEVVRGPGGDLWGANAVNGIIHVITRDAASSRGSYVVVGAGCDERAYEAARKGVPLQERGDLTLYGRGFSRSVRDWNESRGGFRWDPRLGTARLSVNGEAYDGRAERQAYFAPLSPPDLTLEEHGERFDGAHLTATLSRGDSDDGWWLQAYAARDRQDDGLHASRIRTEDLELRRTRRMGRHGLTVGGGLREVADTFAGTLTVSFDPLHDRVNWHHVLPLVLETYAHATAVGTEPVVTWQAARRLRLTATYGWLRLRARPDAGSDDVDNVRRHDGWSPQHQVGLLVRADPAPGVELDGALRAVDGLPTWQSRATWN